MSVKFNGFSRDDMSKINNKNQDSKIIESTKRKVNRRAGFPSETKVKDHPRPKLVTKPLVNKPQTEFSETSVEEIIDLNESMSTSLEEAIYYEPPSCKSKSSDKVMIKDNQNNFESHSQYRGVSLKDFQSHQKLMEEQNKQKKELLYKSIEQHNKKTVAEWQKMEAIKSELSSLDNELATDIDILRKQIEIACINYSNVEKQYNRLESQFLQAKLDLHNASEKKELLTEHLCTVISHNEDRKAKKLTEMMEKVGLISTDNYQENDSVCITENSE